MKKLLILFGVLDLIVLVNNFGYMRNYFERFDFDWLIIGVVSLYLSHLFSAYFLINQKSIGLWISYAQFPLRLLFMILSFGFLSRLARFFDERLEFYDAAMWAIVGMEVLRLAFTIGIHRKYFRTSPSPL